MKGNKRAFTLVEVLAIIVILAIIAIITIPNINVYIQKSNEEAFRTSVDSLMHAYQYKMMEEGKIGRINTCDLDINKCDTMIGYVDISDDSGQDAETTICVYLTDGSYCAIGCGASYDVKPGDCTTGDEPPIPPNIIDISVTDISVDSAKVLVSFTEKGLVKSLKFRLLDLSDNSVVYDWKNADSIDNSSNNKVAKISYKGLEKGKRYKVEVKIENNSSSNNSSTGSKIFETLNFDAPVITYSHVWEKEKNVTITFSDFSGLVNRYSVDTNNFYPMIPWQDAEGITQNLVITHYHYYVSAKSTIGGAMLLETAQIGYVDNENDELNTKPTATIADYKNSSGINTKDVKLTMEDKLSGVGYYCISTTNNSSNCSETGNNTQLNKWVLVSNSPEVRNTTKQHTLENGGTYYAYVKDYVGNISDPKPFTTYKIHYDLNGGSGNVSDQIKLSGTTLILSDVTPTRSGYEFLGWDTNQSSHTAAYAKKANYTNDSNVTLYAIWRKTITITYNGNGGSGSVQNSTCYRYNAEPTCQITFRANGYTRTGYTFKGWALGQNGAISYNANGKYNIDESKTVYAGWQANTLTFNNQSFTKTFDTSSQTINITGASNGNGNYTYSEVSEKDGSGTATNYITIASNGTITVAESTPVGTYTYVVRATSQVSNNIESKTTVTKDATMTITINTYSLSSATIASVPDQIYKNGSVTPEPIVTALGITLVKGTDFTYSYSNNVNVGTATITITGKGNYTGTKSATFTIVPYNISGASFGTIDALTYNGAEQKPTPKITALSKTLVNNTDFTYSYSNNIDAGTGTVTITGKGNFTGTKSTTFTINPYNLSGATIANISNQVYTSSEIKPTPAVTALGGTLANNTDFTYSYSNNINVGTGTVIITGKGNYTGTNSKDFTITKKGITVTSDSTSKTYDGKALTLTSSGRVTSGSLASGHVLTVVNTGTQTDVGSSANTLSTVTIKSGNVDVTSNYDITKLNGTLTVNPKSVAVVWSDTNLTFNNANQKPTATVTTEVTNETMTLSISGEKKAVGTYTATATCSSVTTNNKCSNYTLTNTSVEYIIGAYNLSNVSIDNISNQVYNGGEIKPTPAVTGLGTTLVNGTDYTYSYSNNKDSGIATVTITGKGNYTGTNSKSFIITPKSVAVVWSNTDLTFNNANQKPSASVTTGVTNETMTLTVSGENKDIGTNYSASATCSSVTTNNKCANYTLTNTSTNYSISAYNLSNATVSAISDVNYTGTQHKPTPSVTALGTTLTTTNDFTYSYGENINAGTGTVTVTGKGNYTGSKTVNFNIKRITPPNKTVNCASLTYNGSNQGLISSVNISNGTVYYKIGTELTSSNYTSGSTTKPTAKNADNYVVYWYAPADNYLEAKGSVTCSIAKKESAVTWGGTSFTYNGSNQKPTATAATVITGEAITVTVSGEKTNAGTYTATATCSSVATNNRCANYTLTNASTSYTIAKVTPTLTISATSGTVNRTMYGTYSYNRVINNKTLRLSPTSNYSNSSAIFAVNNVLVFDIEIDVPVSSVDINDSTVATTLYTGNGTTRVYGSVTLTSAMINATNNYSFLDINSASNITSYKINQFKLVNNTSLASSTSASYTIKSNVAGTFANSSNSAAKATVLPVSQTAAANTTYTVNVNGVGSGTATITSAFTPTDTTNYNTASKTYTVTIVNNATIPTTSYCSNPTYNGSDQTIVKTAGTGYTWTAGTTRKNAGSQNVTATLSSGYRWDDGTTGTKTISCGISKATPTLTISATSGTVVAGKTMTYTIKSNVAGTFANSSNATGKATVSPASQTAAANTNYTVTITGVASGSATITSAFTPTDTTNYNTASKTFTATIAASAAIPTTSYCSNPTYNGSDQTIVKTAGTGYTWTAGTTRKNAGSQNVTATLSSGYRWSDNSTGTKTISCGISKATPTLTISATSGTVVAGKTMTYTIKSNVAGSFANSSNATGKATVSPASQTAAANTNYTVTITGVANGSATITSAFTPTDTTNYNTASKTYAATIAASATPPTNSLCVARTYTGSAQQLTSATSGTGYTLSGYSQTNAGTYTITATLSSGYRWNDNTTGTKTFQCTMARKAVAEPSCTARTYNGSNQVMLAAKTSGEYTNPVIQGTNAGNNYSATLTLNSNYQWSSGSNVTSNRTKTCSIAKATPTLTISATSGTVVAGKTLTFTIKSNVAGTFANSSNATGKATVSPASQAAAANTNYTVTITGVANGSATITSAFTPTDTTNYNTASKTYTATITAAAVPPTNSLCVARSYTGSAQTLTSATSGTGYTLSGYSQTVPNTYTITATLSSGYRWNDNSTGTKTFQCTLSKGTPTMNLSATSGSHNIGTNGTITVSGSNYGTLSCTSSNANVATCSVSGTTITIVPKVAGSATITVTGAGATYYNSISKTYAATVKEGYICTEGVLQNCPKSEACPIVSDGYICYRSCGDSYVSDGGLYNYCAGGGNWQVYSGEQRVYYNGEYCPVSCYRPAMTNPGYMYSGYTSSSYTAKTSHFSYESYYVIANNVSLSTTIVNGTTVTGHHVCMGATNAQKRSQLLCMDETFWTGDGTTTATKIVNRLTELGYSSSNITDRSNTSNTTVTLRNGSSYYYFYINSTRARIAYTAGRDCMIQSDGSARCEDY